MSGFDYNFTFEGKEHTMHVTDHVPRSDGWTFQIYLDKFAAATMYQDGTGKWRAYEFVPITQTNRHNIWFELQQDDIDLIGEMIEHNMPDYLRKLKDNPNL